MPPPNASGFGVFRLFDRKKKIKKGGMINPDTGNMDPFLLVDVNDPRNWEVLDQYRKSRSKHIKALLD